MRRREFLSLAGSAVATWPFAARAQRSAANTPVVTLINARKADTATALAAEFRKGLDQAGLAEGKDVVVEYDAVFIAPDGYFASRSPQLATLAARDRMPTSHFVYDAVAAGLLMSYGTSLTFSAKSASIPAALSKAPSRPICRFCNRSNSNSPSTCKPRVRLVSMSHPLCWRAPTK
jgi:hypothetical protein